MERSDSVVRVFADAGPIIHLDELDCIGIQVHGTIGVLFRAIRRGRKTGPEVAALLRSLPAVSSLHVRCSLLEEFIQQAEQSP